MGTRVSTKRWNKGGCSRFCEMVPGELGNAGWPPIEVRGVGCPLTLKLRWMRLHSLRERRLATPGRLELPACGLGNRCSILLSYGVAPEKQILRTGWRRNRPRGHCAARPVWKTQKRRAPKGKRRRSMLRSAPSLVRNADDDGEDRGSHENCRPGRDGACRFGSFERAGGEFAAGGTDRFGRLAAARHRRRLKGWITWTDR